MADEDRHKTFEQYPAFGEPGVKGTCASLVDGYRVAGCNRLKPSEFLLEQTMNITIFESNVFTDLRPLWRRSLRYETARRSS